jgi:hypothetical protein
MQGVECQSQNPKRKAREMKPQAIRQKHPQKTKNRENANTKFSIFLKKN